MIRTLSVLLALLIASPALAAGQKVSPIETDVCVTVGDFVRGYSAAGMRICATPIPTPPGGLPDSIQYNDNGVFGGLFGTGLVLDQGTSPPIIYPGTSGAAHEWITALNASGVGTFVRPLCADLLDSGSGCSSSATTPGGTTGSIQYNSSGVFGGLSGTGLVLDQGTSAPIIYLGTTCSAGQAIQTISASGVATTCTAVSVVTPEAIGSIGWIAGTNPDKTVIFTASTAMTIIDIRGRVDVAVGTTAAISILKVASGTACTTAAGTNLIFSSGTFNANGTASTNQNIVLAGGGAPSLAAGDSVCLSTVNGVNFTSGAGIGGITVTFTVP